MPRYFTDQHEWVEVEGDTGTVGITDYAQGQLGDIVFVEVPEAGKTLTKAGEAAVVESVKAASDVYSPVSGDVTEGNPALRDHEVDGKSVAGRPELVNTDPEGEGWFYRLTLSDPAELATLMDEDAYKAFVVTL